jgi:hypothetical protein
MPVRGGFPAVSMRVAVHLSRNDGPEAKPAEHDEEQTAQDLPTAFYDQWQRPAEGEKGAGAEREE